MLTGKLCFLIRAFAAACLLWAGAAQAQHLKVELVPETARPRAGVTVTLALAATPEPGWHGYWKNGGDAGLEPKFAWTLPAGVSTGPVRYPAPGRLIVAGLMNYVYERPYALLVDLTVPAGLSAGTRLPVRVKADYLVCSDTLCVPETATLATELTIGDGPVDRVTAARFDAWRRALPQPLGVTARFAMADGKLRLAIPYPADAPLGDDAYFYPLTTGALAYAEPQSVKRQGDIVVVETKSTSMVPKLEGVFATGAGRALTLRAAPGDVPAGQADWRVALLALFGAVAGGVLLNVMPCVFPILSLKALSLARSGENAAAARRDALAYTAGVVLVCVGLGAAILALRAGGSAVGWAFQLQDPRVVLALLLLTVAITLNLAGVFELPTPAFATHSGVAGAFATGALAAFVATPCSGPFMGAALGAALVLPPLAALAVFAGLGLGIALPFLLIGFVPAMRRRLPRPGAWMRTFRRLLALPMALTAVALAWLVWRRTGGEGLALAAVSVLFLSAALWWSGRRQHRGRGLVWAPALVALLLSVGVAASLPQARAQASGGYGERFSEAKLASLRAANRPVFAYFTADWCLTCKVNEKAAIETNATKDAFKRRNVAVLVGDWTDGDPALGRFIEAHGRAGVPLYLYYAPGAREPRVLPQVLTPGMLAAL